MGDLNEFGQGMRLFLKAYPWRRIDPVPWTPLRRPLAESKLALVSSAGFVLPGQEPFDGARRRVGPRNADSAGERNRTRLYHLPTDPGQHTDLSESRPRELTRLQRLMVRELRRISAPDELLTRWGLTHID